MPIKDHLSFRSKGKSEEPATPASTASHNEKEQSTLANLSQQPADTPLLEHHRASGIRSQTHAVEINDGLASNDEALSLSIAYTHLETLEKIGGLRYPLSSTIKFENIDVATIFVKIKPELHMSESKSICVLSYRNIEGKETELEGHPCSKPSKAVGSLKERLDDRNFIHRRRIEEQERIAKQDRKAMKKERKAKRLNDTGDELHWSDANYSTDLSDV